MIVFSSGIRRKLYGMRAEEIEFEGFELDRSKFSDGMMNSGEMGDERWGKVEKQCAVALLSDFIFLLKKR